MMMFDVRTPKGGTVVVEVKPHGTRITIRDERLKVYQWSHNAFLGQHGEPFGEIEADNIKDAHDIVRNIVRGQLQRKHNYEEFYERRD
jgi:light-regulated signal transduction histidine kinase (bacteriophytochrome)